MGDVYAAGLVSGDLNALALLVHDDGVELTIGTTNVFVFKCHSKMIINVLHIS